ncbi:hypothetical protein [Kitasatospora sp. MAP5-34]|uniref:hypothetical protein n=1 Tax=Kitasatospora sp. MAP5-34 TaxID=3035102 RepID=UPI002474FEA8|nr:hypothetical protein [Kitasatospora sp. MAP5-34]MDH6577909.1 hypothetical protein [Kitasatospora sp. MAP5-34]
MTDEEANWLTVRQVSTLWPGVASVDGTARANGVRSRRDPPAPGGGTPGTVRYHSADVRRVAPLVTAAPRKPRCGTGVAGCVVLLGLVAGILAVAVWAWWQCPGSDTVYWH